MTRKFLKLNICIIAILCMFCSSLTVFAEPSGELDFDFNIQPEIPETQEEIFTVEPEIETEIETERETEKQTERETDPRPTQRPTQRPTVPQTTQRDNREPDNNWGNNNNVNVQAQPQTTEKETTTEEPVDENLKKGQFYVYLERNNGQSRLKTLMRKKGYVSEPAEPMREGYVFSGWYADPEFKIPWNFMTDKAEKTITIYAKWDAIGDTVVYNVKVKDSDGGTLEVNPRKASMGETVVITVVPEEGKRLVKGSIHVNGEATDFLNFTMPEGDVTVSASFEDIPEGEVQLGKSKLPIIIIFGIIAVLIVVVAVVIAKRRRDFNADLDPDEDILLTDEEVEVTWIDESIVVEDGFVEGKKVVENTEPDYGAPEADEDEDE